MRLFLALVAAFLVVLPAAAMAGTYTSSAHGQNADRSVVDAGFSALGYAVGNCANCHEPHASITGSEQTPPAAEGATPFNLFRSNYGATNRNQLCYACHEQFTLGGQPLGYGRQGVYQGKANYENSDHDQDSNVIYPPGATPPGPAYQDAGNCHNCHDPHGVSDGSLIPNLLFKREETLCLTCHDGDGPSAKDIKTLLSSKPYLHAVGSYTSKHAAGESQADISANKHVECVDCHNPHRTIAGTHTAGTTGNAVSNALTGVAGVTVTAWGPTDWSSSATFTRTDTASKEYEICFKCHSSANTNVTSWGGSGAAAWTDLALEFNPANKSFHPVAAALNSSGSGSSTLSSSQLISPWSPGDTMYCSDCHNVDSGTVLGPHGSSVKWMLAGSNKAWPYTSSTNNGTNSGTFFYLSGTTTNLFCRNCHPSPTTSNSNNVHQKGDHQSSTKGRCINCHIRVPHGGKVSRLIAADDSGTGLPARYYPNGDGTGTVYMQRFKKARRTGYSKGNCRAATGTCSDHNSQSPSPYETW